MNNAKGEGSLLLFAARTLSTLPMPRGSLLHWTQQ